MGQIQDLLQQLNDHHLKAYFLIQSIDLSQYYPIFDPEAQASQVVELFKDFDDSDLKCVLSLLTSSMGTDTWTFFRQVLFQYDRLLSTGQK
jgi:hypothetical protein